MIAVRSEREIEIMRQANQIVAEVHCLLVDMIAPGVTTKALDDAAAELIYERGGKPAFLGYHGYPANTCISVEDVVVHGIPSKRALREGQIVSMDVGVFFKGYYGDAAITVPVGEIDSQRQKLLDTTNLALSRAIKAACDGGYLQ